MEPSRDDFVIAIRSAFLKKGTKQKFSLLGLLFFSILLIVLSKFNFTAINYLKLGINEVVFRTSFIVSLPEKYISYSFYTIKEHIDLYKDYNLTKEELKKIVKNMTEKSKISVRNIRREANDELKKLLKDKDISEDEENKFEKLIQTSTDNHVKKIDEKVETKEKEIMVI